MVTMGIDEVGRGCWAGPLVAGAVILKEPITGLNDSKKLTKRQREILDADIRLCAEAVGLGWVSAKEIDDLGLTAAVRLAMSRAAEEVLIGIGESVEEVEIVIDGNINYLSDYKNSSCLIHGDALVPSISAASIIAKVARDSFMIKISRAYPDYEFHRHVGYGTKVHRSALIAKGPCGLHRMSFKPVSAAVMSDG